MYAKAVIRFSVVFVSQCFSQHALRDGAQASSWRSRVGILARHARASFSAALMDCFRTDWSLPLLLEERLREYSEELPLLLLLQVSSSGSFLAILASSRHISSMSGTVSTVFAALTPAPLDTRLLSGARPMQDALVLPLVSWVVCPLCRSSLRDMVSDAPVSGVIALSRMPYAPQDTCIQIVKWSPAYRVLAGGAE